MNKEGQEELLEVGDIEVDHPRPLTRGFEVSSPCWNYMEIPEHSGPTETSNVGPSAEVKENDMIDGDDFEKNMSTLEVMADIARSNSQFY